MLNLIYHFFTILCLCVGFYFGYTIGKTQRLPKYKSVGKIIRERKKEIEREKKEEEKEKELETKFSITEQYLENINNYPNNQKEIIEE